MKMGEYDPFQYLVRNKNYELNFVLAGSFLAWISKKWWMLTKLKSVSRELESFSVWLKRRSSRGNFVFNHKQGLTERRTRCAKAICYKNRSLWKWASMIHFNILFETKIRVKFCFSRIIFGLNKQKMMDITKVKSVSRELESFSVWLKRRSSQVILFSIINRGLQRDEQDAPKRSVIKTDRFGELKWASMIHFNILFETKITS